MPKDFRLIAVYLTAHLFLDWISFIHELSPLNITPWNPPAGLAMGVLIAFGSRMLPVVWLALTAGDALVRDLPVELWATLVSNALVAGTYGLAARIMCHRLGLRRDLERLRDIALLMGGSGIAAAVVGTGYIAIFMGIGLFSWDDFIPILLRYWVGEVIGIMVLTPVILLGRRCWPLRLSWQGVPEAMAQAGAIVLALWIVFGPLASDRYEYFYLLFLPVVWVASRHGLTGAALAALVTQVGLIVAIQVVDIETARMTHFQFLMLALTVTGLLLGAEVTERRRVEAWVRERLDEFAHASRLTEAGEMTAALAHEINQPLAATMSYARAARKIARRDGASPQLADILDKTVAQAERADRVMRSLRDFVRKGERSTENVDVARLVADSLILAGPGVRQHGVVIVTDVAAGLAPVAGDPIQLQQVLLNLVRNAAEALIGSASGQRLITLSAQEGEPGLVEIAVRDTGPGFSDLVERNLFIPFVTTKATGMGLGLSIARSIVEAHGGVLTGYRLPEGGTIFRFTLPIATSHDDRHAR
ncbi:Sensor histidine kinase [Magnetospirillum sp. XM-1]|uniref:MASE1 domain-containing protein n=1 Tax=Magnetospirillum sp. XM-1 TaxID=1663591 RepID=UPI00073DE028|nr:MASE1 domain-containing protein [Magnetospirillum sp. XM-1]CUW41066.1 Sensor histidine kinase [Magnetospirillum sp. XM-1]